MLCPPAVYFYKSHSEEYFRKLAEAVIEPAAGYCQPPVLRLDFAMRPFFVFCLVRGSDIYSTVK